MLSLDLVAVSGPFVVSGTPGICYGHGDDVCNSGKPSRVPNSFAERHSGGQHTLRV
jgi:hypothetical protein